MANSLGYQVVNCMQCSKLNQFRSRGFESMKEFHGNWWPCQMLTSIVGNADSFGSTICCMIHLFCVKANEDDRCKFISQRYIYEKVVVKL